MEADIRRTINPACNKLRETGPVEIFGKSEISCPQTNQQSFFRPAGQVVPVETGIPRMDLVGIEAA